MFAKIKIKYDNEYILSIINDKIFIFNNEGKFLYKSEDKINNTQTIQSYSLTSIELNNDEYKYIIGFFDNLIYLNLLLYSYNIKENNNKLLDINRFEYHYIISNFEYRRFTQSNKDLSCEYMAKYYSDNKYSNVITCFFFSIRSIATTNYIISNNKLIHDNSISSIYPRFSSNDDYGETFIKSETNYNRTLAFIWFHFSGKHRTYFTIFNITSNTMKDPSWKENCSSEIYKTKINKIPKNNGLALTYEINNKMIKAELYNNIDNIKYIWSSFEINASCENIKGPSISYYNNNQNYYIYYCFKNNSDEFHKNDSDSSEENKNPIIPEPNGKQNSSNRIIIYIIIAIIFIILLVISLFLLIKCLRKTDEQKLENKMKKTKKDEKEINDILSELIPDNN